MACKGEDLGLCGRCRRLKTGVGLVEGWLHCPRDLLGVDWGAGRTVTREAQGKTWVRPDAAQGRDQCPCFDESGAPAPGRGDVSGPVLPVRVDVTEIVCPTVPGDCSGGLVPSRPDDTSESRKAVERRARRVDRMNAAAPPWLCPRCGRAQGAYRSDGKERKACEEPECYGREGGARSAAARRADCGEAGHAG